MMQLSISNIAWKKEQDEEIYRFMQENGFTGLEIAPTRIFPELPYEHLKEAEIWSKRLKKEYGFSISSMQSIWFGKTQALFGADEEREALLKYTKQAIDFAAAAECGNLVFGCPKNRVVPDGQTMDWADEIAACFFKELADYAAHKGTVLALEANPVIYNTNYINDTASALRMIEKVNSRGFLFNLDVGTIIQNGETLEQLSESVSKINHVHISEPGIEALTSRELHGDLLRLLKGKGYQKFISIEMKTQERVENIKNAMRYMREVFEQI